MNSIRSLNNFYLNIYVCPISFKYIKDFLDLPKSFVNFSFTCLKIKKGVIFPINFTFYNF